MKEILKIIQKQQREKKKAKTLPKTLHAYPTCHAPTWGLISPLLYGLTYLHTPKMTWYWPWRRPMPGSPGTGSQPRPGFGFCEVASTVSLAIKMTTQVTQSVCIWGWAYSNQPPEQRHVLRSFLFTTPSPIQIFKCKTLLLHRGNWADFSHQGLRKSSWQLQQTQHGCLETHSPSVLFWLKGNLEIFFFNWSVI